MFETWLTRLSKLYRLDQLYEHLAQWNQADTICATCANVFNIRISAPHDELSRIPSNGPVIIVANHPTGLLEGIAFQVMLSRIRSDNRTLSHCWFERYPKIARRMFLVDPKGKHRTTRQNSVAITQAIEWLGSGGMLTVYPAGEVARFNWRTRKIQDPEWQAGVARIVKKARATVIPVYISGRNSLAYYVLSAIHPRLGALLLIRELYAKCGTRLRARIGKPIRHEELNWRDELMAVTRQLRASVDRLEKHATPDVPEPPSASRHQWNRTRTRSAT